MSMLRRLPLRHQLTLLMTLTSTITLVLAGLALLSYEAARSRRDTERDLRSLVQMVGANSTAALAFGDRRAAEETLATLGARREVASAGLYKASGELFAAYSRPGVTAEIFPVGSEGRGVHLFRSYVVAVEPILLDGETIGTVYVKADVEDMAARLKGFALLVLGVTVASALAGLGLASWLQGVLSRPILQLAGAARQVADTGNYSLRAPEGGPDELRVLTANVNSMLARIEVQDAVLRTARDELEERVRERVRDVQREVQEREQAQSALRISEEKYRSIVETTRDWIWASDREGRSTYNNPAVERILGYVPDELVGHSLVGLIHPEDRSRVVALLQDNLTSRSGWGGLVLRLRHRDGSYRYLEGAGTPILDDTGGIVGFRGSGHDTTERRLLEEQFRQSQKMEAVGRLAGGVAHDFNNLLGVILGYSELLLKRELEISSNAKVEQIRRAAERAAGLTRQLLAFSRKQLLDLRVEDLNAILSDTAKMLQRLIGEDIELQITPAPDLGRARVDAGQMEQVLMNLAVNARDAMPQGGRLVVETANAEVDAATAAEHPGMAPGSFVRLTVSDTGCGMTPEVLSHVFEPFFTTKEKGKGTGLGLATVYGIVKQSRGYIAVESTPDAGTSFHIYLPRVAAAGAQHEGPRPAPEVARGSETLLVVEDEASLRTLARELLEASGYRVIEAPGGAEALALAAGHSGPIHALLTDVVMPGMSGPALANRLKSMRPEMVVLFMSGYTDDALGHHGALTPGTLLLQKPFSHESLTGLLRKALDRAAVATSTPGA